MRAQVLVWMLLGGLVQAQVPVVTRYVPGNYLSDNFHRVELTNPGLQPISLEGYLLVTRDYSVRLPAGARVGPNGVYRIAREASRGIDLVLSRTPDFLIRFHFLEHEGHYIALFAPDGRLLEAAYTSPSRIVPFLPDRDTCITFDGRKIPFYLPPENRPDWRYMPIQASRSAGYVKVKGAWIPGGSVVVAPPAVEYGDMVLRYKAGIATVQWHTRFEQGCKRHVVERSEDQQTFGAVGEENSIGDTQAGQEYTHYEKGLQEGKRYYYRIKGEDATGNSTYSAVKELLAVEPKEEFRMEIISGELGDLRIRFSSRYSQKVRIKLFDDAMREVALLFNDYIYAETPNLVVVGARLDGGKRYLVMATTENGRFGQEFVAGR
jgi:hypothetical protein